MRCVDESEAFGGSASEAPLLLGRLEVDECALADEGFRPRSVASACVGFTGIVVSRDWVAVASVPFLVSETVDSESLGNERKFVTVTRDGEDETPKAGARVESSLSP